MKVIAFAVSCFCLLAQQPPAAETSGKVTPRDKARQILDGVSQMASSAQPEVQVAALLHLAQNYHAFDKQKAIEFYQQAFSAAGTLPDSSRTNFQSTIVSRAANLDVESAMELFRHLQGDSASRGTAGAAGNIINALIAKQQIDRAVAFLESIGTSGEYPFDAAMTLFRKLAEDDPRRMAIFGNATAAFKAKPNVTSVDRFGLFVANLWTQVPKEMGEAAVQALLAHILDGKDDTQMVRTISSVRGTVTLSSTQDVQLFNLMHVVETIDPKRAKQILEMRPELKANLDQFPKGVLSLSPDGSNLSTNTMSGSRMPGPDVAAGQRVQGLAQSRSEEALAALKEDVQKALNIVPTIPLPSHQARVLGAIARSVVDKDPSTARSVLSHCVQMLEEIKEPSESVWIWDTVAEAAHKVDDAATASRAIDKGFAAAIELYKSDTDSEAPNKALREYWPSTQAFRRMVARATSIYGVDAEPILARIGDPDLNLLARIEMAQILLGNPHTQGSVSVSRSGRR